MTTAKTHKRIYSFRLPIWSSILIMLVFLMVGCTTLKLDSHWKDREITIDGENKTGWEPCITLKMTISPLASSMMRAFFISA